ncbi:hypothetical protein ACHAXT_002394 [Thalassiosira profunda]
MNRLRNLLSGTASDDRDADQPWNSRYRDNKSGSKRRSRYNDELYLSDDDDWGMSAGEYGERRGSSAFWDQSGTPGDSGMELPGNASGGLQEWEREAIAREEFEIGNDDFYHSEQRTPVERTSSPYEDVQEDIQEIDDESAASSNKEEVVNAYRDYLKSIRDGGFESYLDTNEGGQYNRKPSSGGEDAALERDLDIEEERASGGWYGDLYGANNLHSSPSPYGAWRAKAKALLQQEEDRVSASPSRKVLERFRRKRSAGRASPHAIDYDEEAELEAKRHRSARHRGVCICICLTLAIVAGLYYYRSDGDEGVVEGFPDLSIPSEDETSVQNDGGNDQTMAQNAPSRPNGPSDAIQNALATFDPTWYNRGAGWEGITFQDSVDFCYSQEKRVPCPYEIYCIDGPDGEVYQGGAPNGEQWSAVSNGPNQWTQVGSMFGCRRYTDLHDGKKPDWGMTGISLEHEHGAGGITQNVMCCVDVHRIGGLDPFTQWGKNEQLDQVAADHTDETTLSAAMDVEDATNERNPNEGNAAIMSPQTQDQDEKMREKAVIAAFQPIWFSEAHGWSGTTYEDAIHFCESYNHMVLCPYAAYCPLGQARPALPGSMVSELDGEEWVPANGPMNTWVQIGTIDGDENTRCTLHHELLGQRPRWGIDGTRPEVKHHIMCCLM